jgi:hypothetical protein
LLVLGSLVACSKAARPPDAAPASARSSTPTLSGTTIHGSGYHFVTPIGWRENTAHMKTVAAGTDSAATNAARELREDVNVSTLRSKMGLSSIGPTMANVLKHSDTEVRLLQNVTLGGLPAVHITSLRNAPNVRDLVVNSYLVLMDGQVFYVQIFADTRVPVQESQANRDAIFRSWVWTGTQGA